MNLGVLRCRICFRRLGPFRVCFGSLKFRSFAAGLRKMCFCLREQMAVRPRVAKTRPYSNMLGV